ncbi:MAG: helix-turn-helix domain-containing protein [Lachnospiraceae bacterium]
MITIFIYKEKCQRIKTMESCQKIKFYRKERNMTQDELAEAANLSTSYISQVETGRKNIGREGLEKIAEALQVLPAMLIQCDDMVRKDVKSCQIMKELEDCSDYELSVIHDILLSLKSSLRENYLG